MQAVRSKDTQPEWIVRKCLHSHGFRYRLHDRRLPGRPDLVLRKYGIVILVQGCFWHGHESCRLAHIPKTNRDWWTTKIRANRKRDQRNLFLLEKLGWTVWTIYECELKTLTDRSQALGRLLRYLYGRKREMAPVEVESTSRYGMVEEELPTYGSSEAID